MDEHNTNLNNTGRVILVGAGCEAGQLTQSGLRAIREADVIVYDDLMDQSILALAREGCELVSVGKRWHNHKKEQEEIYEILADSARKGKRVVRLKGGDPTVFGRGGEEFLAMQAEGIPCELIPGVSSCIAAPEHMGIPVTHRGLASSFTVVTGHGASETAEKFEALAALKGTLVFLMGLTRAKEIAEGLISAGKDPKTPAAILSCVFRPGERRLDGALGDLAELAGKAQAPAILVIGETAGLHLRGGKRPRSALIVGTASFTKKMAGLLREDGMRAVEYPCIDVVPQPEEIPGPEEFRQYDWAVFTSANGVRVFAEELRGRQCAGNSGERQRAGSSGRNVDIRALAHLKFACIGPGTAEALEDALLISADLIPGEYTSESLAQVLIEAVMPGQRVLLLRAVEASPVLTRALDQEKIFYRDCGIYHTQYNDRGIVAGGMDAPAETAAAAGAPVSAAAEAPAASAQGTEDPETAAEGAGFVLFGSAGGVRAFLKEHALPEKAVPVCIGRTTKAELEALTGKRALLAKECTAEGIRETLREAGHIAE